MIEALTSPAASLKLVLWRKWKWKLLQSQLSINIDCGKNMLRKNDSNLFLFPIIISLLIRNSFPAHLLLLMCDIYALMWSWFFAKTWGTYTKLLWFYQNKIIFCMFFNFTFQSTLFSKHASNFSHSPHYLCSKNTRFSWKPIHFLFKIKLILGPRLKVENLQKFWDHKNNLSNSERSEQFLVT